MTNIPPEPTSPDRVPMKDPVREPPTGPDAPVPIEAPPAPDTPPPPGTTEVPEEPLKMEAAGPATPPGPTTPSIPTLQPADQPIGTPGKNEEDRLDEALQETMTTSDPVSIKIA